MDEAQLEFIYELVGASSRKGDFEAREKQKRSAVDNAMGALTPQMKNQIREGMTFSIAIPPAEVKKPKSVPEKLKALVREGKTLVTGPGGKEISSFSEKGQEHAIDTFGATREGGGISSQDQPKVQAAMDVIVQLTRSILDQKGPDDKPLFTDPDEIAQEVFSPLVREGLVPENFVVEQYSEVQKLINETFKKYQESTQEAREAKAIKEANLEMDAGGAVSGWDYVKANVNRWEKTIKGGLKDLLQPEEDYTGKDRRKSKYAPEGEQKLKMGIQTGKAVGALYEMQKDVKRWNPGGEAIKGLLGLPSAGDPWNPDEDLNIRAITKQEIKLDPKQAKFKRPGSEPKSLEAFNRLGEPHDLPKRVRLPGDDPETNGTYDRLEERFNTAKNQDDPDRALLEIRQLKRETRLRAKFHRLGVPQEIASVYVTVLNLKDSDGVFYTEESVDLLVDGVSGVIDIVDQDRDRKKFEEALGRVFSRDAVRKAIDDIDRALVEAVAATVGPDVAGFFAGHYVASVRLTDAVDEATQAEPDIDALLKVLGDGIETAFIKAAPDGEDPTFANLGAEIRKGFIHGVPRDQLNEAMKGNQATAYAVAVQTANQVAVAILDGSDEFKELLTHEENIVRLGAATAIPDEEALLDELKRSEDEIKEYERQLVLIDEGGMAAAEQRSIDNLILQLRQDKEMLNLINSISSLVTGTATGALKIAGRASEELTSVVVGEIVGPIKAAKLIVQLGINIKKAADRLRLFKIFEKNLQRSRTAVSALTSTIQGFLNNKQEQITFNIINDALIAVQAAAAILGTIPEPITMAIGQTAGLVAKAAQETHKAVNMGQNEKKLAAAWKVTIAALNNPRDRVLGVKALELNPSLAMHAIAWAGMEKQPADPVARMLLNDLGLNEQTLAASGTERKVREYLVTLLDEDRQMVDPKMLRTNWAPENIQLKVKDWSIVTIRAKRDATPLLRETTEKVILEAMKKTDQHDLAKLKDAVDDLEPEEILECVNEAKALFDALRDYQPKAPDGSDHGEMAGVAMRFQELAKSHLAELEAMQNAVEARVARV